MSFIRGPKGDRLESFVSFYDRQRPEADLRIEMEVHGAHTGVVGFTTVQQADTLAERLALRPEMRLLDVGAGRGWPGLYIAKRTGCEVVLSDLPFSALQMAMDRACREELEARCAVVMASGIALPFRPKVFDAIVHTDTL